MAKSVLITGVTRGIGRACAWKFAREGWCVTGSYAKSEEAAQQLEQEIAAMGGQCRCVPADVTDSAAVRRLALLAQAEAMAAQGDSQSLYPVLAELRGQFRLIAETQRISAKNIF